MSILSVKNLSKSFGKLEVLNDISFNVEQGEVISIIGPSGSGKSTLMNIIGCLDIPDSGDYILDGEYVDSCTEDELSEIRGIKITGRG